jgi:non-specific serine/threonine protein kinase
MRKIVSFEDHPGSPDGASGYRHHPSLPIALSKIVGRTDEIARVRALFDAGDTRLVTLTGPGGIGKTRLALELAAELRNEFAHGAHLVTLASVQDARLAPAAVASALRIKIGGTTTLVDGLAEALHDQHVLIVLDNVEHVVEGVAPWLA